PGAAGERLPGPGCAAGAGAAGHAGGGGGRGGGGGAGPGGDGGGERAVPRWGEHRDERRGAKRAGGRGGAGRCDGGVVGAGGRGGGGGRYPGRGKMARWPSVEKWRNDAKMAKFYMLAGAPRAHENYERPGYARPRRPERAEVADILVP